MAVKMRRLIKAAAVHTAGCFKGEAIAQIVGIAIQFSTTPAWCLPFITNHFFFKAPA
jgi:hypothetical protein